MWRCASRFFWGLFPFDSDGPKSFGRPRTAPQVRRQLQEPAEKNLVRYSFGDVFIRLDNMAGIWPARNGAVSVSEWRRVKRGRRVIELNLLILL